MNWLESLIYGLVSGFGEFLPISASAHQILMTQLFGAGTGSHLQNFLMRLATLAILLYSCRQNLSEGFSAGQRGRRGRTKKSADVRLVQTAAIPLILGFFLYSRGTALAENRLILILLLLTNGLILFLPSRMLSGNKNAKAMSGWDGLLMGIAGALGIFPGVSRVGAVISVASARGADKSSAVNWGVLLSVPALIILLGIDVFGIISAGAGVAGFSGVLGCILCMAGAGCGTYFGIMLMRFLAVRTGFTGFAYYSWGVALFTFILYLVVV